MKISCSGIRLAGIIKLLPFQGDGFVFIIRGCVISHIPYALKGQKLLAQGSALGFRIDTTKSP